MFATTSFWRDLVAFSWNITTVEDRDGVTDLPRGTLDSTDPSGLVLEEPPEQVDGVTTAWFTFATGVAVAVAWSGWSRRTAPPRQR